MDINVGNGPNAARVYCAKPPVVLGIRALSSDNDAIVVILRSIAITIASMKVTPRVPAPSPKETRQLVATTSPTDIETTLPNIADRWKELELPIDKDKEKINTISQRIENVINNKWKAADEIKKLCNELGNLTT